MKKSFMNKSLLKTLNLLILVIGIAGLESAIAQAAHDDKITYSKDIANIIFEKCASCHNPDGIGPMSLLNYEEVRPWAPLISYKVQKGEMPPWHLDKTIGIQAYKNDISLSAQQIADIISWAEMGAPQGDPDLMPPLQNSPTEVFGNYRRCSENQTSWFSLHHTLSRRMHRTSGGCATLRSKV